MPRGIYIRTKPHVPYNKGKGKGIAFLRANINYIGEECLIWPLSRDDKGYGLIGFEGKQWKASRLMCVLAHGAAPSPMHEAAHSCGNGNKGCVHPGHLSWKTGSENQIDSVLHGTSGSKPGRQRYKLTAEQVAQAKALKGKKTQVQIGAMFGVTGETIGKIFRGIAWKTGDVVPGGFRGKPWTHERRALYRQR